MKIESSSVAMASSHSYNSYSQKESMTLQAAATDNLAGAILTLSGESEGKSYYEEMKAYQEQQDEAAEQKRKENEAAAAKNMAQQIKDSQKTNGSGKMEMSDEYTMKLEMIKRLFAMLQSGSKLDASDLKALKTDGVLDLRSSAYRSEEYSSSFSASAASVSVGTSSAGTMWHRVTATSGFTTETESTKFASAGKVQTADGRDIDFNIEVEMSRAFTSRIDTLTTESYIMTDPLMINLDTDIGTVTDQKFYFDLDSDGKEEEVSFAGDGSGFLALDKNGDGKINDGSELFGTKSGDGFKELAAYDEDGNGWIDENDSIFDRLKVWTKDKEGNNVLMDLKTADVGAVYLGNADTEFSLKNEENVTNGALRKTGIYLKESSGSVGTINHVDLAV